jgi:DNA-directed RNA polymerase specialized sigma24 family protein
MDENFAESLVASSMPADQVLDEAQRMGAVLRELERLPRAERHVLLLSSLEELGTAEMAKVLGRSEMRRAKVIRSSDSEALREMQTASYPAPPMPLTEQEKLLLRIAHKKRSGGVRDVE